MNAVANSKQAKFIVDVSAESKHTRKSSVRFFSYDSKTAEIVIQAEKDNELIPRGTISNVEIYFESVNSSYRPTESLKWNDQMTINDDGLFLYTLTDDLLNYQGLVAFEVYINYINNDKSDSSNRIIYEQRTSAIDRATGEIEIVYIKDMETAKKEVADKAAEVKESLAGYDSGLDIYADQKKTEMDNFTRNVQETSINEITEIQNELPKVKQVNVDETKKIKAEYPIVEQVATTEKEKIRAVLSTVDQTASEISAYADRKISEYDAKFTQSNQKMNDLQQSQTALTTKLTETQQKITDSDVFTKAESSVNVIYQLIGKEEAEILITADFKEKITGSVVENPNIIRFLTNSTFMAPLTGSEPGQVYYDGAMTKDGVTLNVGNTNSDYMSQIQLNWNLVEIVDRTIPELFETVGLTDDSEKIEFIKKNVSYIKNTVDGVGTGLRRNRLTFKTYDSAGVLETEESVNDTAKIQELVREYADRATIKNMISDRGFLSALLFTEASDGVAVSQASLDYTKLEFKIKVSANLLIKLMIAAYCRPLEQQLNDLAQKVAAMENK